MFQAAMPRPGRLPTACDRLFRPRPKRPYKRADYFGHNELSRLVLDTLRTFAGEPIGIEEISQQIAAAKDFDPADGNLRAGIRQRIRAILTRLHKQGVIEGISGGRGSKWKLAGA